MSPRMRARARRDAVLAPSTTPTGIYTGPLTTVHPGAYTGTRRHGNKVRAQGSGEAGYRSAWSRSPSFWTDPKWGRTVSEA